MSCAICLSLARHPSIHLITSNIDLEAGFLQLVLILPNIKSKRHNHKHLHSKPRFQVVPNATYPAEKGKCFTLKQGWKLEDPIPRLSQLEHQKYIKNKKYPPVDSHRKPVATVDHFLNGKPILDFHGPHRLRPRFWWRPTELLHQPQVASLFAKLTQQGCWKWL